MSEQVHASLPAHAGPDRLSRLSGGVTLANGDDADGADADREERVVHAPFTGEPVGSVPSCTEADVAAAVERAREAQLAWAGRSPGARAEIFLDYHDLVLDRQDELLDVVQLESGKARLDAFEEVLDVALTSRYYGQNAPRLLSPTSRGGAVPLLTRTTEYAHPVGVVGVIAPWNYPLTLAVSDAIPALLAGNAVVLKPAEATSHIALLARDLLVEAGLPRELLQVVTGDGATLGPPLIDSVNFVQFTGSTETGRLVARQAGEQLVEASLELGGKNPMLVLDDADLDEAAEGAVRGCFRNAGQLCISFERIYVDDAVYESFLDRFVERTRDLVLGPNFDYGSDVGSLIGADQLSKVEAHVADAREKDATVHVGGEARPDLGPYFFEPTILTETDEEMALAREETFGPVVAVHPVDGVEEAVSRANDSDYGLNASVWTGDAKRGREVARRIECGTVNVNEAYAAAWGSIDAPMGGMKRSGLGRRHGSHGLLKYTESQTIATQRVSPLAPPPRVSKRRYAQLMTRTMRLLKRVTGLLP